MATDIRLKFREHSLVTGRMLGFSKTEYRKLHPGNDVLFNANIFVPGEGKVWWGDIDLTEDFSTLEEIATSIDNNLYILRELDGRFENENLSDKEIMEKAYVMISK